MTIGQDAFNNLSLDESIIETHNQIIGDDFKVIELTDSEKVLHNEYFK